MNVTQNNLMYELDDYYVVKEVGLSVDLALIDGIEVELPQYFTKENEADCFADSLVLTGKTILSPTVIVEKIKSHKIFKTFDAYKVETDHLKIERERALAKLTEREKRILNIK